MVIYSALTMRTTLVSRVVILPKEPPDEWDQSFPEPFDSTRGRHRRIAAIMGVITFFELRNYLFRYDTLFAFFEYINPVSLSRSGHIHINTTAVYLQFNGHDCKTYMRTCRSKNDNKRCRQT